MPLVIQNLAHGQPNLSTQFHTNPTPSFVCFNMLIRLSGYELYKWDTEIWVSWVLNTAHEHGRIVKTFDVTPFEVGTRVRI